jgi:CheY-like chemotaxis protein
MCTIPANWGCCPVGNNICIADDRPFVPALKKIRKRTVATILVVDDSHTMQRLLSLILQRNNHTIVTMDNGRDALTFLATSKVDLVVTDIHMPDMSGLALLDELRANEGTRDLPVIIRTSSIQEEVRRAASQKGASGFLAQPTSSWELKEVVNRCLVPGID